MTLLTLRALKRGLAVSAYQIHIYELASLALTLEILGDCLEMLHINLTQTEIDLQHFCTRALKIDKLISNSRGPPCCCGLLNAKIRGQVSFCSCTVNRFGSWFNFGVPMG